MNFELINRENFGNFQVFLVLFLFANFETRSKMRFFLFVGLVGLLLVSVVFALDKQRDCKCRIKPSLPNINGKLSIFGYLTRGVQRLTPDFSENWQVGSLWLPDNLTKSARRELLYFSRKSSLKF